MPQRDSIGYTIGVAVVLCVVCSLVVSAAAVALKPRQELNKKLDRQRNILDATGLAYAETGEPASELNAEQIQSLYSRVEEHLVNLETGEFVEDLDPDTYDERAAARDPEQQVKIDDPQFDPGVKFREGVARIYFVRGPEQQITQVVLPVYGKGLWSTLYGYLALRSDLQTIQGLTFYEHAETPGLGGEVDNIAWKAQWEGRWLYGEEGTPAAGVDKGPADDDDQYLVDGLSGATITARGVTNLIRYWASDDAFGPFLEKLKADMEQGNTLASTTAEPEGTNNGQE
ncbi:Na(+)-translocating NADH-quinone reductase subunit C [Planctomycetaceae bacterium SH139]